MNAPFQHDVTSLDRLKVGTKARILSVDWAALEEPEACRLRHFGFDEGVTVEPLHLGPFGRDPIAIRVGRMMEEHRYAFYEEPVPFDEIWETKEVADALTIPVALGEQEFSLRRFQWCIQNRAADIMQPDLHYFGGFIRSTKVARMSAAAGMKVVPHMSGGSLGYLDLVHFASFTPNIGPFMEFKGNADIPVHCATSSLKAENGIVRCPTGPGFGVTLDPDFIAKAQPVTTT